jgi:hypothetical protein
MADERIVAITFPKCGTCRFAHNPDPKKLYECHGNPPTPMLLGSGQDQLGRAVLQMEVFSPRVKDDRPACRLYEKRLDFPTDGRS